MYKDFYQLKENPFNVTPDPYFFYGSKSHAEAMCNLRFGIEQRKGILVTVGEVGTGKTTLCRKLLKTVDKNVKFAFILNPNFSETELLHIILHDLGVWSFKKNKFGLVHQLNQYLLKEAKKGRSVVLLIDEAQNLTAAQLEQIRLLSNLETEKEKILQIILVGQPELDDKLRLPELRQLRQRIGVYLHIQPLEKQDIKIYIQHRISKVMRHDKTHPVFFSEQAIEAIYHYTQGTPRKINILCDRALLAGFVAETFMIDEYIIKNCAEEVLYCEHHL